MITLTSHSKTKHPSPRSALVFDRSSELRGHRCERRLNTTLARGRGAEGRNGRVRFVHQSNAGSRREKSRSEIAGSEWVAFLDADDEWTCGFCCLAQLRREFPPTSLCATSTSFGIDRSGTARHPSYVEPGFRESCRTTSTSLLFPSRQSAIDCLVNKRRSRLGDSHRGHVGEDLLTWARIAVAHRIAFDAGPRAHLCAAWF